MSERAQTDFVELLIRAAEGGAFSEARLLWRTVSLDSDEERVAEDLVLAIAEDLLDGELGGADLSRLRDVASSRCLLEVSLIAKALQRRLREQRR